MILPIFVSCLLFGIYHQSLYRILPITLETMAIGYLYYRTDHNILAPKIAHGFGNFFGVVIPLLLLLYLSSLDEIEFGHCHSNKDAIGVVEDHGAEPRAGPYGRNT